MYEPKEIKRIIKPIKSKTKQHKALIMGRIEFEDVQFQLDMTYIKCVNLSLRLLESNTVSDFDYFEEVKGKYKQSENTIYWLGYAGTNDVKILNPRWVEEEKILKDSDVLFPTE